MKMRILHRWLIVFSILGIVLGNKPLQAQDFPHPPIEILKNWDYYKLIEVLGDGQPIIDTMAGQAYISGLLYQEKWFNRDAEVSYYFSDVDIASFSIRFWSPFLSQRTKGRIEMTMDPRERDSIFQIIRHRDSIRNDSVNHILKSNPDYMLELMDKAKRINEEKRRLYDLDSVRCDSLIMDISKIMGTPYDEDMTLHTEVLARYFAIWINHGLAVSLKDFTDYTDIGFSIPVVTKDKARAFSLDQNLEIYNKVSLPVEKDTIDITLYCLPTDKPYQFNEAVLMIEPKLGPTFSEQLIEDISFVNPRITFPDLNLDSKPECWFQACHADDSTCKIHQFFLLENNEPITIFNSQVDLEQMTEGRLINGFQGDLTLSDGTRFAFPFDPGRLPTGLYNSTGKLLIDDMLITGCLMSVKMVEDTDRTVTIVSESVLKTYPGELALGKVSITWKFTKGYWLAEDFQFVQN